MYPDANATFDLSGITRVLNAKWHFIIVRCFWMKMKTWLTSSMKSTEYWTMLNQLLDGPWEGSRTTWDHRWIWEICIIHSTVILEYFVLQNISYKLICTKLKKKLFNARIIGITNYCSWYRVLTSRSRYQRCQSATCSSHKWLQEGTRYSMVFNLSNTSSAYYSFWIENCNS